MEFLYLWKALWRRKWIVLLSVLAAVAAAWYFTRNEPVLYRSTAQVATGFTTPDNIALPNERYNQQEADIKFNNIIENFTSPKVLGLLSYDLLLHDLTSQSPFKTLNAQEKEHGVFKKLTQNEAAAMLREKLEQLQPLNKEVPKEAALMDYIRLYNYNVESIRPKLNVTRLPRTDYINLNFVSSNPDLSAYALNTLVRNFETYYYQSRQQRSDTSIATLDSLVQHRKTELDKRTAAKSDYMAANGIVDVNLQGSNALQQKDNLQNQLSQARATREEIQYKLSQKEVQIRDARAKSGNNTNNTASSSGDNLTYVSLKNQYRDLYAEYVRTGSNNPDIKRRLDDLNAQMRKLAPAVNTGNQPVAANNLDNLTTEKINLEGELRAVNSRISTIENLLRQTSGGLSNIASKSADIERLNRDVELATNDYNTAVTRLNAARNVRDLGISSITQTLVAQPAQNPEPTHRAMIIALAGITAFVLSSLVILLLAFLDNSIRTPSQFHKLTDLKLLGVVNHVKLDSDKLEGVGTFGGEQRHRNDTFRELLRKVRYEIENSGKKIFLFTSTEPRQGKTTLIQALSYSLSLVKKKVLIIDTNFCNNDLTAAISAKPVLEKFGVNGRGFSLEDVKPLITKTSVEGVDMIGCEGGNYTPREILPQNHLLNYLQELTAIYDYIFLEGAPLNDYTDTKELIHYSDGVIAVFSSEAALSPTDKESIAFFKQHNDKFVGAILNKVQPANLDM